MILNNLRGRVAVFGLNFRGLLLATALKRKENIDVKIYDNDETKQGQELPFGIECSNPEKIQSADTCIIALVSDSNIRSVRRQLELMGCDKILLPSPLDMETIIIQMDDEDYINCRWFFQMDYKLNLNNPKTICEKLQWLKLHDKNPEYTRMADKYEFKAYVAEKIGKGYTIPLLGVWDTVDDINLEELPDQFVLKCTHDSGSYIICDDKSKLDFDSVKNYFNKSLSINYFYTQREWPYKNIKPRIIAEKYIESLGKADSIEYKVTCYNGKAVCITICRGISHAGKDVRYNNHYTPDFKPLPWHTYYKPYLGNYKKPKQWDELIFISEKLSENIPFLRVDFYIIDEEVFVGETTFYSWAGFMNIQPKEWDLIAGENLDITKYTY